MKQWYSATRQTINVKRNIEAHLCIFWICVCILNYPARNAHASYCHLWPVRMYHFFLYYLIISAFSKKKKRKNVTEPKMSFEGQDNKLDCSAVLSETTARTPVPDMWRMVYGVWLKLVANVQVTSNARFNFCIWRRKYTVNDSSCIQDSSPVAMYFQELVDFLVLPADFSVSSVRVICNIPVLRGHCCAKFWWTAPVLRISRIVACLFFQNQASSLVLSPHVLGRPVRPSSRMVVRPSTNFL